MPLNRYQPFKRRFLIPWLLTCVAITALITARDGTITQPDEVMVVFFAMLVPFSIGFSLGYAFDFFGAKTGVLKGWFWYIFPIIWWLPLLQFIFNLANLLTASSSVMLYNKKEEPVERAEKLKDMTLEQFKSLFQPEVIAMQQKLEAGGLTNPEAVVVGAILKSQNPSSSLGEILAAESPALHKEKLQTLVEVLFTLVGNRRKI